MTEDLLERQLSDALERRAEGATSATPRFADVERRATRHRRARTGRALGAAVAVAALVVVAVAVLDGRRDAATDIATTPDPAPTATVAPVDGIDRWPVLAGADPVREDVAITTSVGPQPHTDGLDVEVTPYLVVGQPRVDRMVMYGLDGGPWRTTTSWIQPSGEDTTGSIQMLTATSFDPTRLDQVPNATGHYVVLEGDTPPPPPSSGDDRDPNINARPEVLLASPERQHLELPVERLGSFDWVILPSVCGSGSASCEATAIGGDADRVIVVSATMPVGGDVRELLGRVTLRVEADLARPPGQFAPAPEGAVVMPYQAPPPWAAAPFLVVRQEPGQDDSAWPAEGPTSTDYCTTYRQWMDTQMTHLGSFGTPGWIRWVQALDALAPPEVGDAWATLATEQSAGHDTSATQPGIGALDTVVTDGATRCPA